METTSSRWNLFILAIGVGSAYIFTKAIYNIFFHPLRKFPGPLLNCFTSLPISYHNLKGDRHYYTKSLFDRYGPVVRTEPHTLGFISARAVKDIYSHRNASGGTVLGKHWKLYRTQDECRIMFNEDPEPHAILRKWANPAFSERAMRAQEDVIGRYVNLLIRRLTEVGEHGLKPVNLRDWYNFTTFDIIGKLALSSDFGCLQDSGYHPWVKLINFSFRESVIFKELRGYGLNSIMNIFKKTKVGRNLTDRANLTGEMLKARMKAGPQNDFMQPFIENKDGKEGMTLNFEQLKRNADMYIVAGSETTATLLTGVSYLLLKTPHAYKKVVQEVRSSFSSSDEITLTSVNKLPYMFACLNEGLRRYSPTPNWIPRMIEKGNATIDGHFVPQGSVVSYWFYAANMSEFNFTDSEGYHPERFLGDPRFANDNLDALLPFGGGAYDCIGRNLAYAEMRLVLARILFNFDLKLAHDSEDWLKDQKAYGLWWKPDMNAYLTPVPR